MAIVCGTDFSEPARHAAEVAARLAARAGSPLHLIHALEAGARRARAQAEGDVFTRAEAELSDLAVALRHTGADVRTQVLNGPPDEALLAAARECSAQLIVIGALGYRREGAWRLGSHADRLAQQAHVPVWVVRDSDAIASWARQQRTLRIVIGADLSVSAERAMAWAGQLCALGPCQITVLSLYWPPEQFERLGLGGVRDYAGPHPEVKAALERDLRARLSRAVPAIPAEIRVEPHMGRVGDRVARLADEAAADLIVVGAHDRNAIERVLAGSVSRTVLHHARASVVCVPAPAGAEAPHVAPLARVLVPTDFSAFGNAAVALAYAIVAPGGVVHLVHVKDEQTEGAIAARDIFPSAEHAARGEPLDGVVYRRLADLVPLETRGRVTSELHVLASDDVAAAIYQAAERLDASAICMGTRGRGKAARALLGSVSSKVLGKTRRPVLFAHEPGE
jgi:nucleotide-binding universal stress UspA family protein